ncbi:MAG: toxin-antitoxin system HicB family antitoxin [Opitutales bacterium]|nr:toxin-antitoxin system HicB family antitoxin [Opitutales bacterium]
MKTKLSLFAAALIGGASLAIAAAKKGESLNKFVSDVLSASV